MTRPTARVLALLEILQGGGTRTVADLAERLGVDERTLRRYVSHLIDLEIPVESVRGRYGGYRLAAGFRMPPLMLAEEEALALVLGSMGAPVPQPAAENAIAKILRVLPQRLAARLDLLLATADSTATARPAAYAQPGVLLGLTDAASRHRVVDIGYVDRRGHVSVRTVHPYGVVSHNGRWYLAAADPGAEGVRSFRLDRIAQMTVREAGFDPPEGFDPAAHVLASIAGTPWRYEVVVRIRGDVTRIGSRVPRVAVIEPLAEGWVRMRLRAERLDWVPGLLAGIGLPFVVETPDALRHEVRALAGRLLDGARAPEAADPELR
ncbi:helix-turn-helix transcriptional regulator [Hamadaea tsunoensis]|uniref:helix-turn-helix transcriptional regulator n=1 Tax=Hamadaea tsunoensis TaxID=53368 RepID=UPI00041F6569|nr:YafY family protein [Hamadaea tsunoensis]